MTKLQTLTVLWLVIALAFYAVVPLVGAAGFVIGLIFEVLAWVQFASAHTKKDNAGTQQHADPG